MCAFDVGNGTCHDLNAARSSPLIVATDAIIKAKRPFALVLFERGCRPVRWVCTWSRDHGREGMVQSCAGTLSAWHQVIRAAREAGLMPSTPSGRN